MKTDRILTAKIQAWLDAPQHTDREDIMAGAFMLLQCNRNHAMFNQIGRNPSRYVEKIRYELNKFLPARLNDMTREDVIALDAEVMGDVAAAVGAEPETNASCPSEELDLPLRKGIRPDHATLPADIQRLWTDNVERWKRIKGLFETCKSIAKPCERYTHLVALKDSWYKYKETMNLYDDFVLSVDTGDGQPAVPVDAASMARDINNARSYISKNLDGLLLLAQQVQDEGVDEKTRGNYSRLLSKVQDRVTLLANSGQTIGDDLKGKLLPLGVVFKSDAASGAVQENEQGTQHIDHTQAAQ